MSANQTYDPSDPAQALQVVTQCCDTVQGNWATHQVIRQSLATLARTIELANAAEQLSRRVVELETEIQQLKPKPLSLVDPLPAEVSLSETEAAQSGS